MRHLNQQGKTIHNIFDEDGNRIAEYEIDQTTRARTLLREYVWLDGMPVAVIENDMLYFVRTDHIGRPVFATNDLGMKVWEASYLPFGGVHTSTGDAINLRFPGQWFQSESGLHQNWMRDYDPTTGRYIQADPLGLVDGASVYGYVRQNPGRYVDPRGEKSLVLQYKGFLFDPDWQPRPGRPAEYGREWSHKCSNAVLEWHPAKGKEPEHWHYHPNGLKGGRKAQQTRWADHTGDQHLYPPFLLNVPDCPCDGSSVGVEEILGAAAITAIIVGSPYVAVGLGVGAIAQ